MTMQVPGERPRVVSGGVGPWANRGTWLSVCLLVGVLCGCSRTIAPARTSVLEPVAPEEQAALEDLVRARCLPDLALVFPGVGQLCLHKDAEAAVLASLAATELGTAVMVGEQHGYAHPGVVLPLIGLQDLWIYGYADTAIHKALARRELYAPRDSATDLVLAPFNREVLARTDVWAGTLVMLGLGIGASFLVGGDVDVERERIGTDPNLFGYPMNGWIGYPLGAATGILLFEHVAIAEEALFRGTIQSGLARSYGERAGWMGASLLFGLAHGANAVAMPSKLRTRYLLVGLPFITAMGAYMGHVYQRSGYRLSTSVAMHFWYDFLLSATFFALDPQSSPVSASVSIPF